MHVGEIPKRARNAAQDFTTVHLDELVQQAPSVRYERSAGKSVSEVGAKNLRHRGRRNHSGQPEHGA